MTWHLSQIPPIKTTKNSLHPIYNFHVMTAKESQTSVRLTELSVCGPTLETLNKIHPPPVPHLQLPTTNSNMELHLHYNFHCWNDKDQSAAVWLTKSHCNTSAGLQTDVWIVFSWNLNQFLLLFLVFSPHFDIDKFRSYK